MDPIPALLELEGESFTVDAPKKLPDGHQWEWKTVTHALIYATALFEDSGAKNVAMYLDRLLPEAFNPAGHEPLAREALAEILNLWGVSYRRMGEFDAAIGMFDDALVATKRDAVQQYALYNRGATRVQWVIQEADPRFGQMTPRQGKRILTAAAKDLDEAAILNPEDAAAWAQRGMAGLLLGSMASLRVRSRLGWYRSAVEAYDRGLAHEQDEHEIRAMTNNRAAAAAGVAALEKTGWVTRNLGWSSVVPGSVDLDDAMAAVGHSSASEVGTEVGDFASAEALLNLPREEDDDGTRERDPIVVATRLLDDFVKRGEGALEAPGFIPAEAMWLLLREGRAKPRALPAWGEALWALVEAVQSEDPDAAVASLRADRDAPWCAWRDIHVDATFGHHFPERLATLVEAGDLGLLPNVCMMAALGTRDPERCVALIGGIEDRSRRVATTEAALMAAMDAGVETSALAQRWADLRPESLEDDEPWANGEIRRLSRVDLEAALEFRVDALGFVDESWDAAVALFARLAREEGKEALGVALRDGPPGAIGLPRVIGCARGGVLFPDAMQAFVDEIEGKGYAPHILFRHLVEFSLWTGLPDLLEKVLHKGGPHGWQTAQAAAFVLREPEVRGHETFTRLVDACVGKYAAGPVAGRDAGDGGVHVGQLEYRPRWMTFDDPRAVEYLSLVAALDDDAPWWAPRNRPLP